MSGNARPIRGACTDYRIYEAEKDITQAVTSSTDIGTHDNPMIELGLTVGIYNPFAIKLWLMKIVLEQ